MKNRKWTNAKKTNGRDSGTESEYEEYLKSLGLRFIPQPVYILQDKFKLKRFFKKKENTISVIKYISDFEIEEVYVIEIKGMVTATYQLKKKFFLKQYPKKKFIEVVEAPKYISNNFGIKWLEMDSLKKIKKKIKGVSSSKEKNRLVSEMNIKPIKVKGKTICLHLEE